MALPGLLRRFLAVLAAAGLIAGGLATPTTAAAPRAHPAGCAEDMAAGHAGSKAPKTPPASPVCLACCAAGPALAPPIGEPDLASSPPVPAVYAAAMTVEPPGRSLAPDPAPPRILV